MHMDFVFPIKLSRIMQLPGPSICFRRYDYSHLLWLVVVTLMPRQRALETKRSVQPWMKDAKSPGGVKEEQPLKGTLHTHHQATTNGPLHSFTRPIMTK